MLAPSPRVPGIEYRTAYGFTMFDCARLRACLSPANCADNFTQRRCLACAGCPTGAIHAGKTPPVAPEAGRAWSLDFRPKAALDYCIAKACIRCGKSSQRVVGKAYCTSCWNRSLELLHGRNGKGQWPRVTATILHTCHALFTAPAFQLPERSQPIRITRYGTGYWLSGLVADGAELSRLLDRIAPGATLIDCEFLPIREVVITPWKHQENP